MIKILVVVVYIICLKIIFGISKALFALVAAGLLAYGIYMFLPSLIAIKAQKLFAEGKFSDATRYYKKAVKTGRASATVKINYAYALMREGDFEEAEGILNEVIRTKFLKNGADRGLAKQQRCMVYYRQGRIDEALEEAYKLFEGGYKNSQMYAMIGYFKVASNRDWEEATKFCEEAYEYNDENRDIMDNLSICYYNQGKYEEARKLSEKILADNPKFVEAYYHGAQIAYKCNDIERAKELVGKIDGCNRSAMTTVSVEEVEQLKRKLRLSHE